MPHILKGVNNLAAINAVTNNIQNLVKSTANCVNKLVAADITQVDIDMIGEA